MAAEPVGTSGAIEAMYPFAVALALGALIGLERERTRRRGGRAAGPPEEEDRPTLPGGVRTFPLIALLGCSTAWLAERLGAPVFAVGLAGFALVVAAVYVMTSLAGDLGMTTEVAALLTFVYGAMVQMGEPVLAVGLAVATTLLLSARERLHDLALKIETEDLYAALTLAVVTAIVLPLLPDRGFGPYGVLNPFRIWLLVIFISAIGFAGYVGVKLLGPKLGTALAGLLGGLVSSTAATLAFSGRSRDEPALSRAFALAIALAWAAMFVRVVAEVAVVNRALLGEVGLPIAAAAAAGVLGAGLVALHARRTGVEDANATPYRNPFRLWPAVKFGLLFAAVLLAAKAAEVHFRDAGVLVTAGLAGLFDVDAITLTTARLSHEGQLAEATASRAILLAVLSNAVAKAALAVALGSPVLRRVLVPIALASLAAGAAVVLALGV